jgi:2-polyprenyl-3-methyl-5-hydroxy-6-metoxy-1,4-benzoquinol methylase
MDKAGKNYWDKVWDNDSEKIPLSVDPSKKGIKNYVNRCFDDYFKSFFQNYLNISYMRNDSKIIGGKSERIKLLEIGCANSIWLPYFNKIYNFEIFGIDYSEIGCEKARRILNNEGINGKIICSDFFYPPEDMIEKFDIVISFGVIEHFENTKDCINAFSKFLKPGGYIISFIPNLTGIMGYIQKLLDMDCYNIHVVMDKERLANSHIQCNLDIVKSEYFLIGNFGVFNYESLKKNKTVYKFVKYFFWIISISLWGLERIIPFVKGNKSLTSYVSCIAQKNCEFFSLETN